MIDKNHYQQTVRTYGIQPYEIGLLHGGPGAAGEMKPLAEALSQYFGILELLQTKKTIGEQVEELYGQLDFFAKTPIILVGFSWGAWLGVLFAAKYPKIVRKLILISSGSLESKYNQDLMRVRLNRLSKQKREEAERIISQINSNHADNKTFKRFGELMTIADSFNYLPVDNECIEFNMDVYQSVWAEASKLRETNGLTNCLKKIECPVVAFHGSFDPHPIEGVEKPLSELLENFKMIRLDKCGHTPWKEKFAKDSFYQLLVEELKQ